MSCHHFESKDGKIRGTFCLANIFKYRGYTFEFHNYLGPTPLRKDLEPAQWVPKGFWAAVTEFADLPEEVREEYRIYG